MGFLHKVCEIIHKILKYMQMENFKFCDQNFKFCDQIVLSQLVGHQFKRFWSDFSFLKKHFWINEIWRFLP